MGRVEKSRQEREREGRGEDREEAAYLSGWEDNERKGPSWVDSDFYASHLPRGDTKRVLFFDEEKRWEGGEDGDRVDSRREEGGGEGGREEGKKEWRWVVEGECELTRRTRPSRERDS